MCASYTSLRQDPSHIAGLSRMSRHVPGRRAGHPEDLRRDSEQSSRHRAGPASSLFEVELKGLRVDHWTTSILRSHDVAVRVVTCWPPNSPRQKMFIEFVAAVADGSGWDLMQELHRHAPNSAQVETAPEPQGRLRIRIHEAPQSVCAAVMATESACATCPLFPAREDGKQVGWRVTLQQGTDLLPLRAALKQEDGSPARITYSGPPRELEPLTPLQDRVLKMAFTLGHFGVPELASIRDVGDQFGVEASSTSVTIRRGLQKVLSQRYGYGGNPAALRERHGFRSH